LSIRRNSQRIGEEGNGIVPMTDCDFTEIAAMAAALNAAT
jgi:hypothetical protein